MASDRQKKFQGEMLKLAGEFISANSNRNSMITPTSASISPDLKQCTIYFTTIPEGQEENALGFLKRQRGDFRTFAKKRISSKVIPFFDFEVDLGEKNRQLIDKISSESK